MAKTSDGPLDHRDVAVADRLQQLLADPGQREDLLDDRPCPDERADVQADDRDQAEQRVAQRVPDEHLPRRRPLARAVTT